MMRQVNLRHRIKYVPEKAKVDTQINPFLRNAPLNHKITFLSKQPFSTSQSINPSFGCCELTLEVAAARHLVL